MTDRIRNEFNVELNEEFDFEQDSFKEFVRKQDLIYLPGCSAPAGAKADVTHTLPRRKGEMDLRIDNTPHQLHFRAILQSVSIRMALLASILGN